MNQSDEELLTTVHRAYQAGDVASVQAAFAHLQYRHQDRIRGRVALKLPAERIDDLVQDIFIALFEAAAAGTQIINLRAWLNRVAANHVADFYRTRKPAEPLDERLPDDGGQGLAELEALIDGQLEGLSPTHRRVVELAVFGDRSAREVAAETGESEANVYQVVRRFRVALRAAL